MEKKPRGKRSKFGVLKQIKEDNSPPAQGPPRLDGVPPITNLQLASILGADYVGDFDWGSLTLKQSRFIEAYLGEHAGNISASAKHAGYKGSTFTLSIVGSKLLKNPKIVGAMVEIHAASGGSSEEVASRLWKIARDPECKKADVLKALEILGKHYNIFEKHQEAKAAPKLVIDLRRKPKEPEVIDVTPEDPEGQDD